jgi:membrane protein insertase Oxa1/YidC/SpoIIIJ
MMQRETQAAVADLMSQIMAAQPGARAMPAGFDMSSMMNGIGTIVLVFGFFWLAAKIVLYVLGTKYLRRPDIEALFTSTSQEVR